MKLFKATLFALSVAIAAGSGAAFADQEPVKIGVPTALTGSLADLGDQVKRAVTFAVDEANAAGGVDGRKVEARFMDDQGRADAARQQGEKLALDGYRLLTGTIQSGEGLAMAPMLQRWDALYLATINKANEVTGVSCNPRMFRVNRPDNADTTVVKPWLATRKEDKWAIIGTDSTWGHNAGTSFGDAAKQLKHQIVSEAYAPVGTNDFAPYIQAIANAGAQGVWVALSGRDAVNFVNQATQFRLFSKVVVAGVTYASDNMVKASGDNLKGAWTVINYSSTLDTPANKKFVADWAKKYPGTWPTNFEGETYIGMQVLFQAIAKAHSVKPADVVGALSGGTFNTIYGTQRMRSEDHQLVAPNFFGVVEQVDGKLRPVIKMTVPPDVATPSPTGSCKLRS
ncbi:branched-chain amino acid ABC transporter substrate-binding protein [Paraburkholderia dipogonis]|uniref:Branched-chain amino acid ABC transporter substrate-binding protein n=1 Tax=Paraburkholderia dipogonis TaxID=1211383 RepID=A0A4Y8MG94_9BURK|nr:ABC transporter substrate-binding protein [Paraburkholderia dipogonis]TFE36486.1 branched-chain amino acid ABC transporter substrate-binding protein [Paraburkholderia dipogonis]